jgi:hypothetical protein
MHKFFGHSQLNAITCLVNWRRTNGPRAHARADAHPISDLTVSRRRQQQHQELDSFPDSLLYFGHAISGLSKPVKYKHISATHEELVDRPNSTSNRPLHSIDIHLPVPTGQCQNTRHHRLQASSANSATLQHGATDSTTCLHHSECLLCGSSLSSLGTYEKH